MSPLLTMAIEAFAPFKALAEDEAKAATPADWSPKVEMSPLFVTATVAIPLLEYASALATTPAERYPKVTTEPAFVTVAVAAPAVDDASTMAVASMPGENSP